MTTALNVEELDLDALDSILEVYESDNEGLLIPLLQAVQKEYGYLPGPAMDRIARHLRIPKNQVYGVATFYAQFSLKPRGKNIIRVCTGTSCHVRGGKAVLEALGETLGVPVGDTTADRLFTLDTVACLGTCFLSPVMMINDKYYGKLTPHKAEDIIRQYQADSDDES